MRHLRFSLACLLTFAAPVMFWQPALADWPARVFSPYFFLDAGDHMTLQDCYAATGQKYFTLAFIIADHAGNPTWNGHIPMSQNRYADQIRAIRAAGGDVSVSFGGAAGEEIATVSDSAQALAAKYELVIDQYKLIWIDFDIEGRALDNTSANQRRNAAIQLLQTKYPALLVSFTLPADPTGLSDSALALLSDAKSRGVKVHLVNPMTMDFGPEYAAGKTESAVSIATVQKVHEQVSGIDPQIPIGATAMIGQNDERAEIFTSDDATTLQNWSAQQPWMTFLSFWSANRDNGKPSRRHAGDTSSGIKQTPWQFTRMWMGFTGKADAPTR
ncbi:MAG TPA: chitinase [Tepidisphaeraceae bacterium]|nr:chitinase [Tepidisphaeraceae bacterium]